MSDGAKSPTDLLVDLIFAYATRKQKQLRRRNLKLAHYTSADTAIKIIRNRNVWLRNATNMNDYREVQHGSDCLKASLTQYGARFVAALEPLGERFALGITEMLERADFNARNHTYLSCLSEHGAEDTVGRLSMWRAYGGPVAGVALVFNPHFLDFDSTDLAVWTSPVLYGDEEVFAKEFVRVLENLEQNQDLMLSVEPDTVRTILFNALQFAILSSKHKGFKEEKEWRLIHQPLDTASALVRPTFESVGGAPEQVYHLPIERTNEFAAAYENLNLDKLIHRVIIGPCRNAYLIGHTVVEALKEASVTDAASRIRFSGIPLRQQG